VYNSKFEHITRELNTGADSLSQLAMSKTVPNNIIAEGYAINEHNRDSDTDVPLAMSLVKAEQDKATKLHVLLRPGHVQIKLWNFNLWRFQRVHFQQQSLGTSKSSQDKIIDMCPP